MEIKISTMRSILTPPEGKSIPPCPRCFLVPTCLHIEEIKWLSRIKIMLLSLHRAPNWFVVARPCNCYLTQEQAYALIDKTE